MCIHPHTIVLVRHREVCVHTHTHKCGTKFSTVPRFSKYQKSTLKFESTLEVLKFIKKKVPHIKVFLLSTSLSEVSVGRPLNSAELQYEMRTRSQLTKMNWIQEKDTLKVKSYRQYWGFTVYLYPLTAVSCRQGDSVDLRARGDADPPQRQVMADGWKSLTCVQTSCCTYSNL